LTTPRLEHGLSGARSTADYHTPNAGRLRIARHFGGTAAVWPAERVACYPCGFTEGVMGDKKSAPITKHGEQVGTCVPNKGGGMIVDKQGGRGSEGYKGSVKIPPKK